MPAFYLTFLAVLLTGIGARDQMTVAALSARQGGRPAILIVVLACTLVTAAFASWAAIAMLERLPAPARMIFAGIALGLAGLESLLFTKRRAPREPTHSLGALGFVLLGHQITDAARFVIFAMGVAMAAPFVSGLAGALGGSALVGAAWAFPQLATQASLRWVRRGAGVILLLIALNVALVQMRIL
ncbi:hypothetical protein MTR62_10455 [Novosphingobium sp. 1949]|uniref:GDT1 family protein n=1 Tax=Novosphingobium organovorum TaxID=2930092 RepID=A0ABT0BE30_9SPHN|nr:hypothetical protein [Novosphingobium organovorum]MCJ2183108.1 hypothetical protein [Novosphingobium organovorum]